MNKRFREDYEDQISKEEIEEWMESLDWVIKTHGRDKTVNLLRRLQSRASLYGIKLPFAANTPYVNTISKEDQPSYPGNRDLERKLKSIIRWNAMAMVVRANRDNPGIGGHLSSYASSATLYEVAYNHFFHGKEWHDGGDMVFFQGHSAPGIYARAYLDGRLSEEQLKNFRRELQTGGGLSSYPHPYLMPDFWEVPTVSMGLGPLMAIYQARFNRYLEDRGLIANSGKVWAFLGDGETDEPESLGSLTLAGREKLDNLIFVINANLQRLDGPVRGNGKIIQELESIFLGAGWNVIKVIWGSGWDHLLEKDEDGGLVQRMEETVDGEYQKYSVEKGSYIRNKFFGKNERLLKMVEHLSDDDLRKLPRGGHDPEKVYAAYKKATEHRGSPTVIIAKTVKGYGLGDTAEGKNTTHQQKKLSSEEVRKFRDRFGLPIEDHNIEEIPFYKPDENSPEMKYFRETRKQLGGFLPKRRNEDFNRLPQLNKEIFAEFYTGSGEQEISTTMVITRMLSKLLQEPKIGDHIVPIIPDEARTFGMDALFRQVGIYSSVGQKYEPVDRENLLYYKEAKNGQILEEGITEAGSLASFIAAGTSYSTHNMPMIPFFVFYSMFGMQRVGDLVWASGDIRAKGFMIGATYGRTALNGEGLQHQDGHSHLLAYSYPHVVSYDPTFAFELAVILEKGIEEMFVENKNKVYYITVANENYQMPPAPDMDKKLIKEQIVKGAYRFHKSKKETERKAHILFSGPIYWEAVKARDILEKDYNVSVDLWSVTSYKNLYENAVAAERKAMHEGDEAAKPYIQELFAEEDGVAVAVSDSLKALPFSLARWMPMPFSALGTDGFGRSDTREDLREFFEINYRYILRQLGWLLYQQKKLTKKDFDDLKKNYPVDVEKNDPLYL